MDRRPIAHVATEGGVSRQTLSKWVHRFLLAGEEGLEDMSSRPDRSPNRIPPEVEEAILGLRRDKKWGAQRDSEASRTEYLADFLNYYNYERKHSACGYKPPSSRVPLDTFRMQPQADWLEHVDVKDFELQPPLFEDGDDL